MVAFMVVVVVMVAFGFGFGFGFVIMVVFTAARSVVLVVSGRPLGRSRPALPGGARGPAPTTVPAAPAPVSDTGHRRPRGGGASAGAGGGGGLALGGRRTLGRKR
ncbi:hypothetical protein DDQ41_11230 [Streptomyces spongiicola]|uniref:Uncharacterized protein n=1 Tax=Streptomyces spongiicola TaxID=1690221 RepID=A0ABN5KI63_9ACTN|nr:hypothetical protein DDQ41_11230 [Streptomyces spongiicola]